MTWYIAKVEGVIGCFEEESENALVETMGEWLANSGHCCPVITELYTYKEIEGEPNEKSYTKEQMATLMIDVAFKAQEFREAYFDAPSADEQRSHPL